MNEIMSKLRPEECERKNIIHAERSEAGNFFEKIWNKGPKIHCLAIKSFFFN